MKERADAARNRRAILDAASRLFDQVADPVALTMDDVAAAAGVGKGTLFRRFGDRAGLLRAVFESRISALTEAIAAGASPLGPTTPPRERILAILDAVVVFKFNNRQITRALEQLDPRPKRGTLFEGENYAALHALLRALLTGLVGADTVVLTAHALLSLTRIDFLDHLVSVERWSLRRVRLQLRAFVERALGPGPEPG